MHQGCRHGQPLFVPQGQGSAGGVSDPLQFKGFQGPVDTLLLSPARQTVGAGKEFQVLEDAQAGVQGKFLGHVADMSAGLRPGHPQVMADHLKGTARGGQQTAEHAKGGGFSGTVGTEQAENLAPFHAEGQVFYCIKITETTFEIPGDNHRLLPISLYFFRVNDCSRNKPGLFLFSAQQGDKSILKSGGDGLHGQVFFPVT